MVTSDKEQEASDSFDRGQYESARLLFEELSRLEADSAKRSRYLFNISTCLAAEGQFAAALSSYQVDTGSDANYNRALCLYKLSKYREALEQVNQLLDACQSKFSFTDSQVDIAKLEQSHLIEALNLKLAILMKLGLPVSESQQAIEQIPIKDVSQLDCVTLHNLALQESASDIESAIDKLRYLHSLSTSGEIEVPIETCRNLLILLVRASRLEAANDLFTTSRACLLNSTSTDQLDILEAIVSTANSSDDVNTTKLELLLQDQLKKFDPPIEQYRHEAENLIEVIVTFLGSMLWCKNRYKNLEVLLLKVEPILGGRDLWKKGIAHSLYMQDTRFDECCQLYEDLLPKSASGSLLDVDPVVLSNLCISYVLTGRNSDAEILIKDIEATETQVTSNAVGQFSTPAADNFISRSSLGTNQPSHLCVVNLAIGTLYCVKYNYDFGITRILKTLEPLEERLGTQTWFWAKRCVLALLDNMSKQMIHLKDDLLDQVVSFLKQCERLGVQVETFNTPMDAVFQLSSEPEAMPPPVGYNSVTYEARYLRSILLTLIHE